MTNEEAICQLEYLNEEVSIYSDAIDMAIEALSKNSPILSNDFGELTCSQAPKVKLPVESFRTQLSPKGFAKTVRLHSYVAMLTRKDSHEVLAVRYDGFETKEQVHTVAAKEYEDWNIKGVWRLYDEDF